MLAEARDLQRREPTALGFRNESGTGDEKASAAGNSPALELEKPAVLQGIPRER